MDNTQRVIDEALVLEVRFRLSIFEFWVKLVFLAISLYVLWITVVPCWVFQRWYGHRAHRENSL